MVASTHIEDGLLSCQQGTHIHIHCKYSGITTSNIPESQGLSRVTGTSFKDLLRFKYVVHNLVDCRMSFTCELNR